MKIKWNVLDGWSVKNPETVEGTNIIRIYMPYNLSECILMPGDDTIIPTGLYFPRLFCDFQIIPIHHTLPNDESDVFNVWKGELRKNIPILHTSIIVDNKQIFIHVINLGKTELRYKPGDRIAYFGFTRLIDINECD